MKGDRQPPVDESDQQDFKEFWKAFKRNPGFYGFLVFSFLDLITRMLGHAAPLWLTIPTYTLLFVLVIAIVVKDYPKVRPDNTGACPHCGHELRYRSFQLRRPCPKCRKFP